MKYSNAKLKSSGDRESPCFRPFWMGKLSNKCLPDSQSQPVQTRTREGATETIYGNITQLKILITNKKPQLE
jgi:hypothetical protein